MKRFIILFCLRYLKRLEKKVYKKKFTELLCLSVTILSYIYGRTELNFLMAESHGVNRTTLTNNTIYDSEMFGANLIKNDLSSLLHGYPVGDWIFVQIEDTKVYEFLLNFVAIQSVTINYYESTKSYYKEYFREILLFSITKMKETFQQIKQTADFPNTTVFEETCSIQVAQVYFITETNDKTTINMNYQMIGYCLGAFLIGKLFEKIKTDFIVKLGRNLCKYFLHLGKRVLRGWKTYRI